MICFNQDWLTYNYDQGVHWTCSTNYESIDHYTPVLQLGLETAQKIAKEFSNPVLALSGGLDSQVMVECFRRSHVPFTVVIWDYMGLNKQDTDVAIAYCKKRYLQYNILKFDAMSFLVSGEYLAYAKEYDLQSPQFCVHMKCYEQLYKIYNQPIILGGNTLSREFRNDKIDISFMHGWNQLTYARSNLPILGSFLSWDPSFSIRLAKLQKPVISPGEFFAYQQAWFEGRLNSYLDASFKLEIPGGKYTGFEKIKELVSQAGDKDAFEHNFRKPIENKPTVSVGVDFKCDKLLGYLTSR